jgi:hypothetical protein
MEYLGDDLKKVDMTLGMDELELRQSVVAAAKLHATFWNGKNLTPTDMQALLSMEEARDIHHGLMLGDAGQHTDQVCKYVDEVLNPLVGEKLKDIPHIGKKFAAYTIQALRTMKDWNFTSANGATTLCSWDLRTDNMSWRRSPAGPDEYECVILDQQLWAHGCSPMYRLRFISIMIRTLP